MTSTTTNLRFLTLLALAFFISACGARKDNSLFNAASDNMGENNKSVYVVNDQGSTDVYRIKIGDRLLVRNLQDKDFLASAGSRDNGPQVASNDALQTFEVDSFGFINLPGEKTERVSVIGLTRREATAKLQEIIEQRLVKPIISVTVINVKISLLGEFARQGNFLLEQDNMTLIDIISEAGGITANADPKTLKIIRGNKANPEIIYVNLNDINSLGSRKLVLQNNDIITIQQQKAVAAVTKLQNFNNILQPVLVLLNLALLIYTITK